MSRAGQGWRLALRLLRNFRVDEQHTLLVWAAISGLLGALAALGFKRLTELVLFLFTGHEGGFVAAFSQIPPWQRLLVPIVGALLCGLILHFGRHITKGQQTDYMEAITLGDGVVRFRTTLIRSLAAMFAIAGGESIGREGPLVQMAALASSLWGRVRRLPPARLRMLVACGAAAGLAGVYHSPLGGAFFVAEIVIGTLSMQTLGPLLIASMVSALTVQAIEGFDPIYLFPDFGQSAPEDYFAYGLTGLVMGLASWAWIRLLEASRATMGRIKGPIWLRLGIGGLMIGLLATVHPEIVGNGKSLIEAILANHYTLMALAALLGLKVLATCISFGSGAIGGVFTPSLLVGASLSYLLALALDHSALQVVPAEVALIGMGAFLAAAANAPVTAILMIFEMSMQYQVVLPLMIATVIAYATARSLSPKSLYSHSLAHGPRGVLDRPLGEIHVADVMRANPLAVPTRARFVEIAKAFLQEPRQELWVTNAVGLAGCFRLPDVGPFLRDADSSDTIIALDLAHEDIPRLQPGDALTEAFRQLSLSPLSRLPVVDAQGTLVGEVTRADIFLTIAEIARLG